MDEITDEEIKNQTTKIASTIILEHPRILLAKLLKSLDKNEQNELLLRNFVLIDTDNSVSGDRKELQLTDTAASNLLKIMQTQNRRDFLLQTSAKVGAAFTATGFAHEMLRGGQQNMAPIEQDINNTTIAIGASGLGVYLGVDKGVKLQKIIDSFVAKANGIAAKALNNEKSLIAEKYVNAMEPLLKAVNPGQLRVRVEAPNQMASHL